LSQDTSFKTSTDAFISVLGATAILASSATAGSRNENDQLRFV
jgi:hypothetical protein